MNSQRDMRCPECGAPTETDYGRTVCPTHGTVGIEDGDNQATLTDGAWVVHRRGSKPSSVASLFGIAAALGGGLPFVGSGYLDGEWLPRLVCPDCGAEGRKYCNKGHPTRRCHVVRGQE